MYSTVGERLDIQFITVQLGDKMVLMPMFSVQFPLQCFGWICRSLRSVQTVLVSLSSLVLTFQCSDEGQIPVTAVIAITIYNLTVDIHRTQNCYSTLMIVTMFAARVRYIMPSVKSLIFVMLLN